MVSGMARPGLFDRSSARQPVPNPAPAMRLHDTPAPRMPLPASSIDLDGCKRRFLYQYVYQLYDDLSPFLRMHQAIRECVKTLTEQARAGVLPADDDAVRSLVFGQLQRYELDTVLYAEDYATETLQLRSGGVE